MSAKSKVEIFVLFFLLPIEIGVWGNLFIIYLSFMFNVLCFISFRVWGPEGDGDGDDVDDGYDGGDGDDDDSICAQSLHSGPSWTWKVKV